MAKFLSKQNLEHVYDYLKRDLETINIDLDSDKKYMKAVKKMMRSIDNQATESGNKMSIDNMNMYSIGKIKPFLVNLSKKFSAGNNVTEFEPEGLSTSNMGFDMLYSPESKETSEQSLDALFNNSITNNSEITEETNMTSEDFQKKLQEAQNSRGYSEYAQSTGDFREEISKANALADSNLEKMKKKKDEQMQNEFYGNLYENSENPLQNDKNIGDQTDYKNSLREGLRQDPYSNNNNSENGTSGQNLVVDNYGNIIKNVVIRNQDHSKDNQIEGSPEDSMGYDLDIGENAEFQPVLFENTRTGRERIGNYVLNIDSGTSASTGIGITNKGTNYWSSFSAYLDITLNVDKLCEIYLESITFVGQTVPDICQYFAVKINEFNIASNSNNPNLRDSIIIPNTADMEYLDLGILINNGGGYAADTPTLTVDGNNAQEHLKINDCIYTNSGEFIGAISAVGETTSITIDGNTKIALSDNNKLFLGRLKNVTNEYNLQNAYLGTINPTTLLTMNVEIKNQDGNHADSSSPDNTVFKDASSSVNRVMLSFVLKAVEKYTDF